MKERNSKRVLSWLLTLAMVFSLLPTAAFASEAQADPLTDTCICDVLCGAEGPNGDCPVCAADPAACTAEAPAEEPAEEPADTVTVAAEIPLEKVNFTTTGTNVTVNSWADLKTEIAKTGTFTITLGADLTADSGVAVSTADDTYVTVDGNGHSITRGTGFKGVFFGVPKGSVTMTDLTLDGGAEWNEHGPSGPENGHDGGDNNTASDVSAEGSLIYVSGTGAVVLGEGTILQNNQNLTKYESSGGGAVTVDGGSLTIQGNAIIRDNYYHRYGSAVYAGYSVSSTVTIQDRVLITGNVSGSDGAAITSKQCNFTMSGGTITGNKALGGYVGGKPFDPSKPNDTNLRFGGSGGIFFVGDAGSITMSGTVNISDNYQYQKGVPALRNVLLTTARSITVGDSGLDPEARIGVYAVRLPSDGADIDVKVATNAKRSELVNFVSDDSAFADVIWCNGKSGVEHADAYTTSTKHTAETNTIWFSEQVIGKLADTYVQANYAGNDSDGTKEKPFTDLADAYAAAANNGVIHVMENLPLTTGVNFDQDKAVTILSDDGNDGTQDDLFSILRDGSYKSTLLSIDRGNVTLRNITVDGEGTEAAQNTPLVAVRDGASAVLDSGVTLKGYSRSAGGGYSRGAVFVTGNDSLVTMKEGALITGNSAGYGGGVVVESDKTTTARFLMEGGEIAGNTSTSTNTAAGYGGAGVYVWGGTFEMTGGSITGNTSAGNGGGIEVYTGAAKLTGGEISDNTAQRGGGVLLDSGTLTIGGTIKIDNNKDNGGQPQNVYLARNQIVSIDPGSHLTEAAKIGVFTADSPAPGADIKIATGANSDDLKRMVSDNAAFAGIVWCNGETDGENTTHTDTPITTAGHVAAADTLWLSVDARMTAAIDVGLGSDGTLTITAKELDPGKFYTVLDKDGVPQTVTVAGGSAGENGWYKPGPDGTLIFSGLPLDGAPYQVVTNDADTAAPNGKADATSEIKVGGQIAALYVAGGGGSGWGAGDDTTGAGTKAAPYKTLTKAYAVLDEAYAQAGIITVLSDIEQGAALTFKATTGAIILGEGENVTIKRAVGDNASVGLFDVNGCAVTFSDLIFDGNGENHPNSNAAFSVRGGSLTLKDCVVENSAVKGNANGNWDKSLIHCGADADLILDGTIVRDNSAMMSAWPLIASGNLTFKNSSIVNNHTNGGSAVAMFASAKLEGVVVIDGNTYGASNIIRNLSVADVQVDAAGLAAGSKVGVTGTDPGYVPTEGRDVPVTTGGAALAYFRSDEPNKYGVKQGGDGEVYLGLLSLTAGDTDADGKTSIIIDPADPSKDYWAVDDQGNKVGPGTMNGDGTVTIAPLDPGVEYDVVIVEKGTPGDNVTVDGSGPHFTAPNVPVDGSKVDRGDGTDPAKNQITVNDPSADLDYALVDKDGNFILPDGSPAGETDPWQNSSDGSALTWDSLDPDETYQVVSRPKDDADAIHSQGTPVLPNVPKESIGGEYDDKGDGDPSNDTASIVIKPADGDKTYWAVDDQGNKFGPGAANGDGSVTISGLTPGEDYRVIATPNAEDDPSGMGGGVHVVVPAKPATAPDEKDGGYKSDPAQNDEIKRENGYTAPYTDTITIKAEDGYSYAVRGEDGKYYPASGGTAQTGPAWQSGSAGSELTFADLPNGQKYEVVKIPTGAESGFDSDAVVVLPAVTEVPAVTNIGADDVEGAVDSKTGSGYITVDDTDAAFQYVVLDKDGNAVSGVDGLANPQTGNGGKLTFQPLMPGQDYTVVAVPSTLSEDEAKAAAEARKDSGSKVSIPALNSSGMIAGKDPVNSGKTTITIAPASGQVKYVLTDESGNVVKVDTAANGKVVFDGLDPEKLYKVYTVPADEADPSGTVTLPGTAADAMTPSVDTANNAADGKTDEGQNVTLDKTTTSITVKPTETGKEYAILDPDTGLVVGVWEPGTDGAEVTFDGLVSGKQYQVLVRDAASGGTPASVPVSLGDVTTNTSGGGSSGGGGGSSGTSSNVKVESNSHGTVTVSPTNPGKSDKVIITCKPDSGYQVGSVTVTDKNGNTIVVTDEGNGKYSYIQPDASAQPVTVKVSFEKTAGVPSGYGDCLRDETCPIARFTDARATEWYHDGVHYCVENGLMQGTSATTFSPGIPTDRGMIVTILYRLEGEPSASGASYPDIAEGQYYTKAVAWAAANGIVMGYSNGDFGPNDPITREQMAAILHRYAAYKGYDLSAKADLGKFNDSASVSGYAVEALSWANAEGLINGKGEGVMDPQGHATRAEAAMILMRFCESIAK